jgi:hypothetical protein
LLWGKGTGVNGCTECVCCEYFYGERELRLTDVLNVCVLNIIMGKVIWGLAVVLNVCVVNIFLGKGYCVNIFNESMCCEYFYGVKTWG